MDIRGGYNTITWILGVDTALKYGNRGWIQNYNIYIRDGYNAKI